MACSPRCISADAVPKRPAPNPSQEEELHKWYQTFAMATPGFMHQQCLVVVMAPTPLAAPLELVRLKHLAQVTVPYALGGRGGDAAEEARVASKALWAALDAWLVGIVDMRDKAEEEEAAE